MAGFRIPQSVAARRVLKAYLSTDHFSAATGKTIAVTISKNGAAFANPSAGATSATEIGNGWYYVDLSTTDTATKGPLIVRGTSTGVDDVEIVHSVVDPNNADFAGVPAAAAGANGGVPVLSSAGTTLAYTVSTLTTYTGNTPQTGDSFARIGATGSGLTSLAPSATALSTATWTSGKAAFLDAAITSRLAPTVAARTLDVSATGEAGIDWGNVGNQTAVVNFSSTSLYSAGRVGLLDIGSIHDDSFDATGLSAIRAGLSTLDAAGVRSAVGLAAANLDTQLAAIGVKTTNLPAQPAAVGSAMTLSGAGLDAVVIEAGVNARQALSGILAGSVGVLSGATPGGGTVVVKGGNVATTRVTATCDAAGNRTSVTLNLPA